jgi:hypothetical protein
MSPFLSMFVPVFLFLMLLTIGFSLRERNIGVLMMWIGTWASSASPAGRSSRNCRHKPLHSVNRLT